MTLAFDLEVHRREFDLCAADELREGEVLAVLGPNGSGKSTLLRAICGLQPIDAGTISIDDRLVDSPDAEIYVPPERRDLGVVLQGDTLFANLDVVDNIAFGPRLHGSSRRDSRRRAMEWIERMDLIELAHRRPSRLSGGQVQRVALARALAVEPRLLLLDEPMSALDSRARAELRRSLRARLTEIPVTTVLVTHDPVDAYALADRILVLEDGRVTQTGTLADVTGQPRSRHIADMIGRTIVTGTVTDGILTTDAGTTIVVRADAPAGRAIAVIAPSSVVLHATHPEGSSRNAWEMRVTAVDRSPDRVRVLLTGGLDLVAELTPAGATALDPTPGSPVWASVKASEIVVLPD